MKQTQSTDDKVFHYDSVGLFYNQYYAKLLTENLINGTEMFIEKYKEEQGIESEAEKKFLFPLKKDKFTYLIPSEYITKLPIMVNEFQRMSYSGKGYRLVTKLKPMKITPQKTYTFKKLVDLFAKADHSNITHDLLWRLISIIAFVDRINIRVATNPEFGKDSKLNIINSLTGEIGKISNPTIAKLEYLLFNKICFINEVSGINSQSRQDVEQFILQCGDFNNEYNKRSRASAGSSEKYDISKMSLVIAYNDLPQYSDTSKFFDFMWGNKGAVNNRILPLLFNGKIQANFDQPFDVEEVVKKNYNLYISFLRALLYYKNNPVTTIKYDVPDFYFDSDRWKRNFNIILKWVAEYSENQEEFLKLSTQLYKAHTDYLVMINHKTNTITNNSELEEKPDKFSPLLQSIEDGTKNIIIEYLEKYDTPKGIDIEIVKQATNSTEEQIQKLKKQGDIFEVSTGRIKVLQ